MGTQGKAAIIYNRVSTKDQAENGTSLQSQEAACIAKAQELGFEWRVTREAYTGTKMHDRKLLMRDLDELKSGRYQALIFYKRRATPVRRSRGPLGRA